MILGNKTHLVGLDIGSKTIKAAEVVATKKNQMLKNFATADIPSGLIEDGTINDPETLAEIIRHMFKRNKIRTNNIALSVGGYSVIVKRINVQTMSEEQLQDAIQTEAEQYIPFDISDVNLDFQILNEDEDDPEQMNVLLVAAKKEMIAEYISLLQMAGLTTKVIDVDAFALQNIYEVCYDIKEECVALIDIGNTKTSLNILIEDQSQLMRDVSLGCIQINQKIASIADCSLDEAEHIKLSGQSERIPPERFRKILNSVISDWCTEIRRAFDFFYSTNPDEQIQRIILSGGGANITEFNKLLQAETSAEVVKMNPFKNFKNSNRSLDPVFIEQIAPQAAICMGLALRRVNDK
jgi:type IV pilus assembly protein PilM